MRLATLILAALLAAPVALAQQSYPDRPVRIVAPFAPGGLVDVLSRAVGERLQKQLGQPYARDRREAAACALQLVGNSPDQFGAMIVAERARWGEVIKSAGIKLQ